MSKITDSLYKFVRQKASDQLLFVRPPWFNQALADMKRHEGFYEYAYPDPLSPLAKKYPIAKHWGRRSGRTILQELGGQEALGRPWTYGYGFTGGVTPDSYIPRIQADRRLEQEIMEHAIHLDSIIPNWKSHPVVVQTVLVNLVFNLGPTKLRTFTTTLGLIRDRKYIEAGENLKKSLWYKQVGTRGKEITQRLITLQIAPEHRV